MLYFHPLFGEDSHFDLYLSEGLKPPTRRGYKQKPMISGHVNSRKIARMLSTVGSADLEIMWLKSMGIQRPLKCFEDMDW